MDVARGKPLFGHSVLYRSVQTFRTLGNWIARHIAMQNTLTHHKRYLNRPKTPEGLRASPGVGSTLHSGARPSRKAASMAAPLGPCAGKLEDEKARARREREERCALGAAQGARGSTPDIADRHVSMLERVLRAMLQCNSAAKRVDSLKETS